MPDSIPEDHAMQVAREWGNRIVTGDYEAELAALLRSEFPGEAELERQSGCGRAANNG